MIKICRISIEYNYFDKMNISSETNYDELSDWLMALIDGWDDWWDDWWDSWMTRWLTSDCRHADVRAAVLGLCLISEITHVHPFSVFLFLKCHSKSSRDNSSLGPFLFGSQVVRNSRESLYFIELKERVIINQGYFAQPFILSEFFEFCKNCVLVFDRCKSHSNQGFFTFASSDRT